MKDSKQEKCKGRMGSKKKPASNRASHSDSQERDVSGKFLIFIFHCISNCLRSWIFFFNF